MRDQFNAVYWASFSPEVQELANMDSFSQERMAKAVELAVQGYSIDGDIQARGSSPWETMKLREGYGYTWVPSLLQAPLVLAPGIVAPGVAPYDPDAYPAGSIRVSSKESDYPPAIPPKPVVVPTAVPAKPNFHIPFGSGMYAAISGDSSPDGKEYSGDPSLGEPAGVFVKHITDMIGGGKSAFWRLK